MAPLLVSALVGIGVKIATDFFMSGAKKVMKPDAPGDSGSSSFASMFNKLRGNGAAAGASGASGAASVAGAAGVPPAPMTASAGNVALDAGLADRSKVMAAGVASPSTDHAYGVATYRRLTEVQAP